jgi:selenocysteine lyase/cysteine desulfurase
MESDNSSACAFKAQDGTCYGHQLKSEYFLLASDYCNLNHGSYGTIPKPVVQRQQQYVEEQESRPDAWFRENYFTYIDTARSMIADYVKAMVADIVLVENASSGVNSVLRSLGLKVMSFCLISCALNNVMQSGEKVLILSTAYGMVKETLNWLVDTAGIEVIIVNIMFPMESPQQITLAVSDALAVHSDVKLCVFSHISSMVSDIPSPTFN